MKVFVAGATGALGSRLVPMLVAAGHTVTGTTRTPAKLDSVREMGARAVLMDALDAGAVASAVAEAEPEVVVHQATALSGTPDLRNPDRFFTETNRLRTEGTDHLLAAARAVGARKFVAQSFAGWPFARVGGPVKTENDPLDDDPPAGLRETLAAIRHLEAAVAGATGIEGVVLRYGGFYGPGTGIEAGVDSPMIEMVRRGRFPVIGSGAGVWSFVHIDDAAAATVAAIERGEPGVYQIVDDEPAPVAEWLPALAQTLGARPPRRIPRWVGRLAAGAAATMMMTASRGASNEKAKRALGWTPRVPTWRIGFTRIFAS